MLDCALREITGVIPAEFDLFCSQPFATWVDRRAPSLTDLYFRGNCKIEGGLIEKIELMISQQLTATRGSTHEDLGETIKKLLDLQHKFSCPLIEKVPKLQDLMLKYLSCQSSRDFFPAILSLWDAKLLTISTLKSQACIDIFWRVIEETLPPSDSYETSAEAIFQPLEELLSKCEDSGLISSVQSRAETKSTRFDGDKCVFGLTVEAIKNSSHVIGCLNGLWMSAKKLTLPIEYLQRLVSLNNEFERAKLVTNFVFNIDYKEIFEKCIRPITDADPNLIRRVEAKGLKRSWRNQTLDNNSLAISEQCIELNAYADSNLNAYHLGLFLRELIEVSIYLPRDKINDLELNRRNCEILEEAIVTLIRKSTSTNLANTVEAMAAIVRSARDRGFEQFDRIPRISITRAMLAISRLQGFEGWESIDASLRRYNVWLLKNEKLEIASEVDITGSDPSSELRI